MEKRHFAHAVLKNNVRYTCEKLFSHKCDCHPRFARATNPHLCQNHFYRTCIENNYFHTPCAVSTFASLGQQTHTCVKIIFIALVSKITIYLSGNCEYQRKYYKIEKNWKIVYKNVKKCKESVEKVKRM